MEEKLIKILACPICKGDVEEDSENNEIHCVKCKMTYPVSDGIPVMLKEKGYKKINS